MTVDIATLGIGIDSSQVDTGANKLGNLTKAGAAAEKQTKETTSATAGLASILRETIAAIQSNTQATSAYSTALADERSATAQAEAAERGLASARAASQQAARDAAAEAKRLADEERRAAKEADDLAGRIARLQSSVQPFAAAQAQANAELMEAEMLYRQGAISAEAYAQAQMILTTRAAGFAQRQDLMNQGLMATKKNLGLTATEGLNFSRQMSDIGVTAAMGMNPLMIAIQQGPQILDVFQQAAERTGTTVKAVAAEMAAAWMAALAPFLPIIAAIGIAIAGVAAAWGLATRDMNKQVGDNIDHLKLTERQLDRLKEKGTDTGITMGDSFRGLGTTIKEYFTDAFGEQLDWLSDKWSGFMDYLAAHALDGVKNIVGPFVGALFAIEAVWKDLPSIFADVAITAANGVIGIVEMMVNKVIQNINLISGLINNAAASVGFGEVFGDVGTADFGRIGNEYAGAARGGAAAAGAGFSRGNAIGRNAVDAVGGKIMGDWRENSAASRDARVTGDAGDEGRAARGRKGGQSDAEKEYERQVKAAQEFIKSLKQETEELGKNSVQVKMMGVERAAALAPTVELAAEIRAAGDAWKTANDKAATDELLRSLQDLNGETAFNNSLQSMNARERATAIAQRELDIRLRDLERQGITINTDVIKAETDAIKANAEVRGDLQFKADEARDFADAMGDVNRQMQDAVAGLGDLAGAAGSTFGELFSLISDYGEHQASVYARIAETEAQYGKDSQEANRERARSTEEMAQAEVNHYGNMLSAAKGFFDEKSTAYKVMQAAETAYRLYQFAMAVQSMFFDTAETTSAVANAGVRMGVDAAETASSVSKSGIRAAADGVAAFAKTLASLPFPFNIAAGAVVLAALVGVGVAMSGKGGGAKSATASAAAQVDAAPSSYTPYISQDTPASGSSIRYGGISPNAGYQAGAAQSMGNTKTNVFDFSGANFGNSDPEAVKNAVRQGIEEAKPDLLADAREQNIADLKTIGRNKLGG